MKQEHKEIIAFVLSVLAGVAVYVLTSKVIFDGAATPKELLPFAGFLVCTVAAIYAGVSVWKKHKP